MNTDRTVTGTQYIPTKTALLQKARRFLDEGKVSQVAAVLEKISDPEQLPPEIYKQFVFLTLSAALYGFDDADRARKLNAGIKDKTWATIRYRLALRQKDFVTAARIRRLPDLSDADRWDFRCTMGLHLIWSHRYKWGFHFYQDRWHAINFTKILPQELRYHPPGDPADDPPLVVLEQGVGECLLALMHLSASPPEYIVAAPKYHNLVQRVLPQVRFVAINDIPKELHGAPAICAADLFGRAWLRNRNFRPPRILAAKIRDLGAVPVYGICWRGGSGHNRREERHIPLHLFLDLLPRDARYIPLQFDMTKAERNALRADGRCQPDLIDVRRDPEQVLQIVRRLAGVISVDSANWHFAGAADIPFLALMNKRSHWLWGPEARAEWTYSSATTIAKTAMSATRVRAWMDDAEATWRTRPMLSAPKQAKPALRPILMAGLPRSGTSMTMNILAQHGVWIGRTMAATTANPNGFFENMALKDHVVKRILSETGADPNGVAQLPDTDNLPILPGLELRILDLLAQEGYDGTSPWGFKDPKLTLIWPVFARAFPDAHWIIPRRARDAVIRSLTRVSFMRRHSSDPEYWAMFCTAYEQRLEALARSGAKVHFVDTDALVAGDYSTVQEVLASVGIPCQPGLIHAAIDSSLFGRTGG